jgi:single-stranded-DNA-specific exonuclease
MADRLPPAGVPCDMAVELNWNFFNDRRSLQLELIDWRASQ